MRRTSTSCSCTTIPADAAPQAYARLAHRLTTWLTSTTAAGRLYDTDLRLRPDGASGLPVSSLAAFRNYQRNTAWTWEHQALTRARFVAGDARIGAAFEAEREAVLRLPRDQAKLRSDIVAMRTRMQAAHPNRTELFDVKHDPGGMVDVEFAVQFLVLAHSDAHPDLTRNAGNIALLALAAALAPAPRRSCRQRGGCLSRIPSPAAPGAPAGRCRGAGRSASAGRPPRNRRDTLETNLRYASVGKRRRNRLK